MPPATKYSKEKIIECGLNIIKNKGIESVSARSIASELGCSICPVFSCFENMEMLKRELLNKIFLVYKNYVDDNMQKNDKPFKGSGIGYIKFAKENKNYFKALFMSKTDGDLSSLLNSDSDNKKIIEAITKTHQISYDAAKKVHECSWVFVHGIAVMIATDYCKFSDEKINEMLTIQCLSLIENLKKEHKEK